MSNETYIGHRYVPQVEGEWSKNKAYEELSIVLHEGSSYTSKQKVPEGVDITNDTFWILSGNYNAQMEQLRQDTTAQLEQTDKSKLKNNISNSSSLMLASPNSKETFVTFIDDDGYKEVITRMKPIFDAKGIKATLAIVSDLVGRTSHGNMTKEELLDLQKEGWEIASHEKTHIYLDTITDEKKIYSEIIQSKEELLGMGFNVKNLVYPFGRTSDLIKKYVKKVYRAAAITGTSGNDDTVTFPLDTYAIRRVDFSNSTFAHYKSVVDKAITEKSWVIFMTHMQVQNAEHDLILGQLIDYIQSLNIKIGTFDEGLDIFGDRMAVDGVFRLLPDNSIKSDTLVPVLKTTQNKYTSSNAPSEFPVGSIITTQISTAGAASFPESLPGTLITDSVFTEDGFKKQTYKIYNRNTVYERTSKNGDTWDNFLKLTLTRQFQLLQHDFGTVAAFGTSTTTVTVTGATLKDTVICTPHSRNGLILDAYVSAPNTVTLRVLNATNAPIISYSSNIYGYIMPFY